MREAGAKRAARNRKPPQGGSGTVPPEAKPSFSERLLALREKYLSALEAIGAGWNEASVEWGRRDSLLSALRDVNDLLANRALLEQLA